jgi:hypothetical protein
MAKEARACAITGVASCGFLPDMIANQRLPIWAAANVDLLTYRKQLGVAQNALQFNSGTAR